MTSWMKERDRLVEQTMAFVQGVAANRPIKSDQAEVGPPEPTHIPVVDDRVETQMALQTPASDASLVEAEALMSLIAMSLPSLRPEAANRFETMASVSEPIIVTAPSEVTPAVAPAPVYVPTPKRTIQLELSEREMIAQRVAKFQAGQLRFIREREDNYATTQAKIRATLGNDPEE